MGTISTERQGAVVIARLDNPPRNYITVPVLDDLRAFLDEMRRDREARAVVFTGARPGLFLTHLDVPELIGVLESAPVKLSYRTARAAIGAVAAARRVPGLPGVLARTPAAGLLQGVLFEE